MMRGVRYLVMVAGVVVLVAGCGTKVAPVGNVTVTAAAADTQGRTARVAVTTTMRMQGMSVSFTETGAFDFAHSRGVLRMQGPGPMANEERFIPPKMYLRLPRGAHGPLPRGKSWIAINARVSGGIGASLLGPFGGSDPRDLLSSLTAISSSVAKVGSGAVRGVETTQFSLKIDPAKAASRLPRWQRPGFHAFARSLGAATVPADVWVDQQNLVRQVRISLHPPGGLGAPAGARMTQTVDFYDFGVPVRVAAPPASAVASISQFARGGAAKAIGIGAGGSPRPPRASGTLSPAQVAAAEQVVRGFWSALGSNDAKAAAQTVLPAQRGCLRSLMSGPTFTVTSIRIVSAQPSGNARATVRFEAKAQASLGGQHIPVFRPPAGGVQWVMTTEAGGHWYVDLARTSSMAFGPAC